MIDIVATLRAAAEAENEAYLATLHSEELRPNGETVNHYHWRRRNALHDAADIMRDASPENVDAPKATIHLPTRRRRMWMSENVDAPKATIHLPTRRRRMWMSENVEELT